MSNGDRPHLHAVIPMGHIRLGTLPDTIPWRIVVAHIAEGSSVSTIAGAAIIAAMNGLRKARGDKGVGRIVYLLAQTVLAARENDFSTGLGRIGIHAPEEPTLFDLTCAFTVNVRDWYVKAHLHRSDVADIIELSAVEA